MNYINNFTKIQIICPIHGIFLQIPHNHIKGCGCIKCNHIEDIICKEHGIFYQIANYHLSGNGCPKCKLSKGSLKVMNWLEKYNIKYELEYTYSDCKKYKRTTF